MPPDQQTVPSYTASHGHSYHPPCWPVCGVLYRQTTCHQNLTHIAPKTPAVHDSSTSASHLMEVRPTKCCVCVAGESPSPAPYYLPFHRSPLSTQPIRATYSVRQNLYHTWFSSVLFYLRVPLSLTPCLRTSSATKNASDMVILPGTISRSLSLATTSTVSAAFRSSASPAAACLDRCRPSNSNGSVTTATVTQPMLLAAAAITGAAPVPVPPPIPLENFRPARRECGGDGGAHAQRSVARAFIRASLSYLVLPRHVLPEAKPRYCSE